MDPHNESGVKRARRAVREAWYGLFGGYPARVDGRACRCHVRDRRFWQRVSRGQWETHTFDILRRFLHADAVYFDVGAWIGPTVLAAAPRCRHVYCFEPDALAYERLLTNLRLNGLTNVTPQHLAIYTRTGFITLGHPKGLGRSGSSVLLAGAGGLRAPCTTLEAVAQQWAIDRVDLVKMDIEGAEFDVLPASTAFLERFRPTLYLSLHAHHLPASERPGRMQAVAAVARRYRRCLDRDLKPLDVDRLATTQDIREVVLTDRPDA